MKEPLLSPSPLPPLRSKEREKERRQNGKYKYAFHLTCTIPPPFFSSLVIIVVLGTEEAFNGWSNELRTFDKERGCRLGLIGKPQTCLKGKIVNIFWMQVWEEEYLEVVSFVDGTGLFLVTFDQPEKGGSSMIFLLFDLLHEIFY